MQDSSSPDSSWNNAADLSDMVAGSLTEKNQIMVEIYAEKKFLPETAKVDKQRKFRGTLPTTICQAGLSDVYGQNPDIDSTSLISTSQWILTKSLR